MTKPAPKKWQGTWPKDCDICSEPLSNASGFFDAATKRGPWGLMCPACFAYYGIGLGTGMGQKYDSKTLLKTGG